MGVLIGKASLEYMGTNCTVNREKKIRNPTDIDTVVFGVVGA